ncbi:NADH:ubiquinone reductase (Na(+)-transporting) subunit A [Terasakiispira papahanaumokuakeensis]|uniref:Na(+)-translocating NADH-quinone reductase subunit A n=1 Tax=Terasakiispira papahanaumokuakeensis TaxID=197479 RepID=A0A1E2V8H8_9GAMM|nr:Na(+)-translocating NADH-quinone reductase subunit A [Terasakiispira papahanaumokuakeensis]ODC02955.1 NADH:ubiquinone reductase (Na(+)-transporting) subunit A [Terasakiispira papahanaumokuakeensis]
MIKIKRGLDLPVAGAPAQTIEDARAVRNVAVLGPDYVGMKPTMLVSVGDKVKKGQIIFTDKKTQGVKYTAPGSGEVVAINRGFRRALQSVVIQLDETESSVSFKAYGAEGLSTLTDEQVREQLIDSGLWTALRTRPFSRVPAVDAKPRSIFVTAIDSHPLSADPATIIAQDPAAFEAGLKVLSKLTDGKLFVCKRPGAQVPSLQESRFEVAEFDGPHPAGLVGTHIHFLDPVDMNSQVWHLGYQDVIALGHLFVSGQLHTDRVIALGGPMVKQPRLLKTRMGASLDEILAGELETSPEGVRVISGSIFSGSAAEGPLAYLGRYHNQVSVLEEGTDRKFMGWLSPGGHKHSVMGIYLSKLTGLSNYKPTTTTNGSERAMVPVGSYEKVMPLDVLPTQLLRSLIVGDVETAMKLGCLELDEEDLALCTYACPGKYEYGPILRDNLTLIEKEG